MQASGRDPKYPKITKRTGIIGLWPGGSQNGWLLSTVVPASTSPPLATLVAATPATQVTRARGHIINLRPLNRIEHHDQNKEEDEAKGDAAADDDDDDDDDDDTEETIIRNSVNAFGIL